MCGAMFLGMALFMVATISVAGLGNATLFEPTSIAFQAGMSLFMAAPMAAWMRIGGCDWRACGEMSAVMCLPLVAAAVLRSLDLPAAQLWVSSSQHALMIVAMLAFMLYRHEDYTRGYSLSTRVGHRAAKLPSLPRQGRQPAARVQAR
jgi:hypothetical protein